MPKKKKIPIRKTQTQGSHVPWYGNNLRSSLDELLLVLQTNSWLHVSAYYTQKDFFNDPESTLLWPPKNRFYTSRSTMKRQLVIFIFFAFSSMLHAQHQVTFVLKEQTEIKHDSIYVVGTFNNWDSLSNNQYLMAPQGNKKVIVLTLDTGTIGYKFHRGNWLKVEKKYNGGEVDDRIVKITGDTILIDSVQGWRDEITLDKKIALRNIRNPSDQVPILAALAGAYAFYPEYYNVDSALHYAQKAIDIQQQLIIGSKSDFSLDQKIRLFSLKEIVASLLHALGNYPRSLELRLENFALAENSNNSGGVVVAINNIIDDFVSMKDYPSALKYGKRAESVLLEHPESESDRQRMLNWTYENISFAYFNLGKIDSALIYANKSNLLLEGTDQTISIANTNLLLADIYAAKGDSETALKYYQKVISEVPAFGQRLIAEAKKGIAKVYRREGKINLALSYAKQAIRYFEDNSLVVQSWGENSNTYIAELSPLIADLYWIAGKPDSAYHYLQLSVSLKDSLYNTDKIRQFQTLTFNEASRRQQIEQDKKEAKQQFETKVKLYGLVFGLVGVLLFAYILYRNNRQKQLANEQLRAQKDEIERALGELKITQAQLIHAEKMASLGELTAGIAHEIQNPLNFVNNFSEVSEELMEELRDELKKGAINDATSISDAVIQNLEKISYHGKRASSIVKGMLDHSRANSEEKIPTDINALTDEYLRLAYHGLRARDKSFNAEFKLELDPDLPKINVVPQDIGRVLLNLINNAFQACANASKGTSADRITAHLSTFANHHPTVIVSTRKHQDAVEITISDNGPGIPEEIKDKIFQPFFTTKPPGEGTGLGLSLAYDIVKAHGGKLTVQSEDNAGSTFTIKLPTKI